MVIVMRKDASGEQLKRVREKLLSLGFSVHESRGVRHTILGAVGDHYIDNLAGLEMLQGVERVIRISAPYKLASRVFKPEATVIDIDGVTIGGESLVVMAGPCAVENEKQINTIAREVARSGAKILRGGVFKPRTSPYSFQGLGMDGLVMMHAASRTYGLKIVTEVMDASRIAEMLPYVDIFQVGARNMQNYALLSELGKIEKPVLLKRGISATIDEWLSAADYILNGGNYKVILCERGIRSFDNHTRNTLDLSAIPVLKDLSHLPVIVDPSHGVGKRNLVPPMARAAIACGADGLLVEVHHNPDTALSDGAQSLLPEQFEYLCRDIAKIAPLVNRSFSNGLPD